MTTPQPPYGEPTDQPSASGPTSPGSDVLGNVLPAHAPEPKGRLRKGLAVGAVLGVLGVTGAGVAAAVALSGGGAQPEDVVPADALAFAKLDLDPSAGQKLNLFRLSQRFPAAADRLRSEDTLRDDLLRLALEDSGVDYDREVKPWIGDRAAVAAVPTGGEEPGVLVVLGYTDRDQAQQALEAADEEVEFAFVDDFVLVSDDAQVVEDAAAATDHLADEDDFSGAVEALDGDQIALAWVDAGRAWGAVPDEFKQGQELDPSGQVVVGLHAESDALEITGRTVDVRTGVEGQDVLSTTEGTDLVGELPGEALAAVAFAGLGESLGEAYGDLSEGLELFLPDFEAQAEEFGISLPDDLVTLLGSETAVAAWGDESSPEVLVRTRSDDPEAAADVLRKAFEAAGGEEAGLVFDEYVQEREDGLAVGTPGALAAEGDALGELDAFDDAVPDADDAGFVLWFSIQDALELAGEQTPDTEALEAFGITADGGDGEFRARLTFR